MWKTIAESGWTDVVVVGTAIIWALILIVTWGPVRKRLHLTIPPIPQLGLWFEGVKPLVVHYLDKRGVSHSPAVLGVDVGIKVNAGVVNICKVALRVGGRSISPTLVQTDFGKVVLPFMLSETKTLSIHFPISQEVLKESRAGRIRVWTGKRWHFDSDAFWVGTDARFE